MSIAANALAEACVAAQATVESGSGKTTPPKRRITAKTDATTVPEAR